MSQVKVISVCCRCEVECGRCSGKTLKDFMVPLDPLTQQFLPPEDNKSQNGLCSDCQAEARHINAEVYRERN